MMLTVVVGLFFFWMVVLHWLVNFSVKIKYGSILMLKDVLPMCGHGSVLPQRISMMRFHEMQRLKK